MAMSIKWNNFEKAAKGTIHKRDITLNVYGKWKRKLDASLQGLKP
jgi:hypothetical protein